MSRQMRPGLVTMGCALALGCAPPVSEELNVAEAGEVEADHFLPSRPETLNWGWFPIDKEPVLRIASGETVRIETLTHVGATQDEHPVEFLTGLGVPREEVLDDVIDFWASREGRPREGRSGHVITGPVHIEGAEPGDMLEVRILDIETRVPWGVNSTSGRGGVFSPSYPGAREGGRTARHSGRPAPDPDG